MGDNVKFEWDPDKNRRNLKKHKVDFEEAKHVFRKEEIQLYKNNGRDML